MGHLLLGIDVGTYSRKGVLVETATGTVVQKMVIEHTMDIPHPGWAEQDADEIWWKDVVSICNGLVEGRNCTAADISGIAFSAIGPTLLALDAFDKHLRPGILYGVDTRANEEIDLLNEKLGEENVFEFSKMAFSSQAIGPKILWLQRHEPQVWVKVKHVVCV